MTEETVKIISGVLALVLVGIIIMRRKGKGQSGGGDDF